MTSLPPALQRVCAALGTTAIEWQQPECGLSPAQRWVTRLADGRSVFVKAATDEATAAWLRTEHTAVMVAGTHHAPEVVDWLEGSPHPILVTEDLSTAYWPAGTGVVRWRPGDMTAVRAAVDSLVDVDPGDLEPLPEPARRWAQLMSGDALERSGLCDRTWISAAAAALLEVDSRPWPGGSALVHGDVRSDNLCLSPDGGVRFVDWSHAGRGNRDLDLVNLLPTLCLEGGPAPGTVLSDPVEVIVRTAGATVARAAGESDGPSWLAKVMVQLAGISLRWVADVLDLPPLRTT